MGNFDIFWSLDAELDLDNIFEYYFEKSPLAAHRIINDIIDSAESLIFSGQFQLDEYKTGCRRIVIRHYKVLYTVDDEVAYIVRVFDSRRNPKL